MIMLTKLLRSIVVLMMLAMISACSPSIDIHLSECMKTCNDTVATCTTDANAELDKCEDLKCQKEAINKTEQCFLGALDCTQACVDEMQKHL